MARLPAPEPSLVEDPVEVLWQRTPGVHPKAVVLMLHGCSHQGTDFWPKSAACERCLGLPEELRVTNAVLERGHLPVAVTSADRASGCWRLEDLSRVEAAVEHVYQAEGLVPESTPLYAMGSSSGGALVGRLTELPVLGGRYMRCRIPMIMRTSGQVSFGAGAAAVAGDGASGAPAAGAVSWKAPPTLFVHMPRDEKTAGHISEALESLRKGGVPAAEVQCKPLAVTPGIFAARIAAMSPDDSAALASALWDAGLLDAAGMLEEDPRGSGGWRSALLASGVPQRLGDELAPDLSAINEVMNVIWGKHNLCSTFADEMLQFCEDPHGACLRFGWSCG